MRFGLLRKTKEVRADCSLSTGINRFVVVDVETTVPYENDRSWGSPE